MNTSAELEQLLEERAILAVLTRYCRGIDRLDEELVRSCYHDDSTDDHGVYKGKGIDFASFAIPVLRKAFTATMHTLGQSIVEFEPKVEREAGHEGKARAETYVVARHRRSEGEGETLETVGARYLDRLEKRAGQWKLCDRIVVYEWATTEAVRSGMPIDRFAHGIRSKRDLAYG